jgi:carboxyl-terminal processing protease
LIVEVYGAYARICTKWDRMPDGTEFVGVGVQPDVRVELTRQAIAAGRDLVVERAVQVLRGTR